MADAKTKLGGGFVAMDRLLAEVRSDARRPGYVLLGDEAFLQQQCRKRILDALINPEFREYCVSEIDLSEATIFDALDQVSTPSLMAPFQVIFVRNVRLLYQRGAKKEEFAAIHKYLKLPNPQALLVFVADHLHIPSDVRRMDMQDKDRYERIRETLGDGCGIIELSQPEEPDAIGWAVETAERRGVRLQTDAARELVDALHGDLMRIASELEKLLLFVDKKGTIALADVELMVVSAKQRSLYELTDAISAHEAGRALLLLQGLLNASESGEDGAIGHLHMLARTFRQMLVIQEKNVRDSRGIWQALWPGFRVAPFAVDDLIRQARRYKSRGDLMRMLERVARADLEIRSSPPDKMLVLERMVIDLARTGRPAAAVG
ncbi:MAG TPA: DNA polymerase III subunit delta [Acidobacteriaceae bacterium]|nr:DNA polymerase III subunit delta [Acidobacteriaceae bacterium]